MNEHQILFILGAGASRSYNYPTGKELQSKLLNELLRLYNIYNTNHGDQSIGYSPQFMADFSKEYNLARTEMIDYYLATIKDTTMQEVGKLGIALAIIDAEIESAQKLPNFYSENDWFALLQQKMTFGFRNEKDLIRAFGKNFSFITFNYDRSLEHYFSESLKYRYQLEDTTVVEIMTGLKIEHVFGRLPFLPLESGTNENKYGAFPSLELINKTKDSIKLLHERRYVNKERIVQFLNGADIIIFLGFGFAEENIKLLDLKTNLRKSVQIFATAKDFSNYKIQSLSNRLLPKEVTGWSNERIFLPKPIISNLSCRDLLDEINFEY